METVAVSQCHEAEQVWITTTYSLNKSQHEVSQLSWKDDANCEGNSVPSHGDLENEALPHQQSY